MMFMKAHFAEKTFSRRVLCLILALIMMPVLTAAENAETGTDDVSTLSAAVSNYIFSEYSSAEIYARRNRNDTDFRRF